jgi:hypothetical protein
MSRIKEGKVKQDEKKHCLPERLKVCVGLGRWGQRAVGIPREHDPTDAIQVLGMAVRGCPCF